MANIAVEHHTCCEDMCEYTEGGSEAGKSAGGRVGRVDREHGISEKHCHVAGG